VVKAMLVAVTTEAVEAQVQSVAVVTAGMVIMAGLADRGDVARRAVADEAGAAAMTAVIAVITTIVTRPSWCR
jgi:hypothetical protein